MENRTKKILSVVLAVVMVVSLLPIFAMADEVDEKYIVGGTFTADSEDAELPTYEGGAIPGHTHWEGPVQGTRIDCEIEEHSHGNMCAREPATAEDYDFSETDAPSAIYYVCTTDHTDTEGAHEGCSSWATIDVGDYAGNEGNPGYRADPVPGETEYFKWTCPTEEHSHASCPTVQTYTWTLVENEWITGAKVYRVYKNEAPTPINTGYNAKDYGPKGDDTPYFTVSIDRTMLEEAGIDFNPQNNRWYISTDTNKSYTHETLWNVILNAMSAADQQKFMDAFGGKFIGYVLKQQSDSGGRLSGDVHIDGYLKMSPPVYAVELFNSGTFVSQHDIQVTATEKAWTYDNVIDFLISDLGLNKDALVWNSNRDGGTYEAGGVRYTFTFKPQATKNASGTSQTPTVNSKGTIGYVTKTTDTYYLAQFNFVLTAVPMYSVTYKLQTDGGPFNQYGTADKYYEGADVEIRGDVKETGYDFSGWKTKDDLATAAENFKMGTKDVTIYGKLTTVPQFTIKYIVNDVEEDSQTVTQGKNGTAYNFSVPEGYSFSGWYSDAAYENAVEPNLINVRENMNFYGKTTINSYEYTINYYKDSLEGELLGSINNEAEYNAVIPVSKTLYAPAGYVTPGTGAEQLTIQADSSKNVVNIIYTDKQSYGYTVNYYKDSISEDDANLLGTSTGNAVFGANFKVEDIDPDIDDFLPEGYAAPGAPDNASITISEDASGNVINVVYEKASYKVEYFLDGTLLPGISHTAKFESTVEVAGKPEKTGYTVSDWSSDDVTPADLQTGEFTMPAKDVKIYATSAVIDYTVTYVDEDGRTVLQDPITVNTGDSVPGYGGATPTKAPDDMIYTFSKWTLKDGELINGKVGETNLIYQASYEGVDAEKYSVIYTNGFDSNSTDYRSHYLVENSFTYETYIPLNDSQEIPGFENPGHTFVGWELREGSIVLGNETVGYSGEGGSIIYYDAVWEKIPYTLMVTKTVSGAELPEDFYIELTSEELEEPMRMDLNYYDDFDEESNTYMWIAEGLFIGDYTATEYNYEIAGFNRTGTTSDSARLEGTQDLGAEIDGLIALSNIYTSPNSPASSYSLTVNHIGMDEEGNPQLLDREGPASGYALGAPYITYDRAFDGWSLYGMSEGSAPTAGSIEGDTTVTYIYALNADILEEEDPLGAGPGDEVVVIPDPDDPLAPGTIVIPDDPAPLSDAPQTGDNNNIALMIAIMAACAMGIVVLNIPKKKRAQG